MAVPPAASFTISRREISFCIAVLHQHQDR
jgi:hypothetical protein